MKKKLGLSFLGMLFIAGAASNANAQQCLESAQGYYLGSKGVRGQMQLQVIDQIDNTGHVSSVAQATLPAASGKGIRRYIGNGVVIKNSKGMAVKELLQLQSDARTNATVNMTIQSQNISIQIQDADYQGSLSGVRQCQ